MTAAVGSDVRVADLTHRYGEVVALDNVSLESRPGEFLSFLGPSGCGKTTLLRAIAGFLAPTSGTVEIAGVDVTRAPAHRRPVNMVFQRPALFPHLDVAGNVGFGLSIQRLDREEIRARVTSALSLVRLDGFERRRAHELSGGEMQRVALARAIVKRPQVLLLDEPLSALDLKIRLDMEVELRRLHREIGATFIYVTHDQREALALGDRVAVFNEGRIVQLATPSELYVKPASRFAAQFVGDANVLPVEFDAGARAVRIGVATVAWRGDHATHPGKAWLVLRPETIGLTRNGDGLIRGVVRDVAFRGGSLTYRIEVAGLTDMVKAEVPVRDAGHELALGDEVGLVWDPQRSVILARETE